MSRSRWTFGSVLFLASWAILMGPITYTKHLVSGPRLPFTAIYFGSIFMTLYSAMAVCSIPPHAPPRFALPALANALPPTVLSLSNKASADHAFT